MPSLRAIAKAVWKTSKPMLPLLIASTILASLPEMYLIYTAMQGRNILQEEATRSWRNSYEKLVFMKRPLMPGEHEDPIPYSKIDASSPRYVKSPDDRN